MKKYYLGSGEFLDDGDLVIRENFLEENSERIVTENLDFDGSELKVGTVHLEGGR